MPKDKYIFSPICGNLYTQYQNDAIYMSKIDILKFDDRLQLLYILLRNIGFLLLLLNSFPNGVKPVMVN